MTPTELENNINCMQEMIHKFECEVVEKQENLIMQTIQQIGGETYSHITIDKNKVLDAFRKYTPTKPTHEASLYRCFTCPTCKNVIDEFTEIVPGQKVRVQNPNCKLCGQTIDWGDCDVINTVRFIRE